MFDAIKAGFNAARNLFSGAFSEAGIDTPTRNEMRLDADEFMVKRKLGRSFFTKQLNENTRVARVASLNEGEFELARSRGWVR